MLKQIALTMIFGKPLIVYGGLTTLLLLLITATIGLMIMKGKKVPIAIHVWLARLTIVIAVLHAILGLSLFL
ncbi:MAG: hypothetical protein WC508_05325 [Patescibacteria group bacterium]